MSLFPKIAGRLNRLPFEESVDDMVMATCCRFDAHSVTPSCAVDVRELGRGCAPDARYSESSALFKMEYDRLNFGGCAFCDI